jgi:hypothetical protein
MSNSPSVGRVWGRFYELAVRSCADRERGARTNRVPLRSREGNARPPAQKSGGLSDRTEPNRCLLIILHFGVYNVGAAALLFNQKGLAIFAASARIGAGTITANRVRSLPLLYPRGSLFAHNHSLALSSLAWPSLAEAGLEGNGGMKAAATPLEGRIGKFVRATGGVSLPTPWVAACAFARLAVEAAARRPKERVKH